MENQAPSPQNYTLKSKKKNSLKTQRDRPLSKIDYRESLLVSQTCYRDSSHHFKFGPERKIKNPSKIKLRLLQ